MKTFTIKSKIGTDGILKLEVPTDEKETDVEVVIVIQSNKSMNKVWPKDFFKMTYGCLKDNKIERYSQGDFPVRDKLI